MKDRKVRRPSSAMLVAIAAIVVSLVGTAIAVPIAEVSLSKKERKQTRKIASRLARKIARRLANRQITKRAPNLSVATANSATTAGAASTADSASIAHSLAPAEGWHEVGAAGEPGFLNSWESGPAPDGQTAAFYKDYEGIVHLRGMVTGGIASFVFQLPVGYRPPAGKGHFTVVWCGGLGCPNSAALAHVFGSGFPPEQEGAVSVAGTTASLDGISFRAES
jgi:hypothetical protein